MLKHAQCPYRPILFLEHTPFCGQRTPKPAGLGCRTLTLTLGWSLAQEDASTPERLDSMPDIASEVVTADPVPVSEQNLAAAPEAATGGDLRQQLEARRRARAGQ